MQLLQKFKYILSDPISTLIEFNILNCDDYEISLGEVLENNLMATLGSNKLNLVLAYEEFISMMC